MAVEPYDDTLFALLELVRGGHARTRPELVRRSGQGRKLVAQRIDRLIDRGLIAEGELGPSSGGRAPRELRFRAEAGHILVAVFGGSTLNVGLTDLAGRLIYSRQETAPPTATEDPEVVLSRVEELFDELIRVRGPVAPPIWGVGLGVPSPVDAATGRPFPLPRMLGWGYYPLRERFVARYDVPVWVDNEGNVMALGEFRGGVGRSGNDLIFVNLDAGIGTGLISNGRLHRGAHGMAGELGHSMTTTAGQTGAGLVDESSRRRCWCGNTGCLVMQASGHSMLAAATVAAEQGLSRYLSAIRTTGRDLTMRDLAEGVAAHDEVTLELFSRTGTLVGQALANLVSSFDPSLVVIGGPVAVGGGDLLLAAIRQALYQCSFPMSTRDLQVVLSAPDGSAGLTGASFMVADELLSRTWLPRWLDRGSPGGGASVLREATLVG